MNKNRVERSLMRFLGAAVFALSTVVLVSCGGGGGDGDGSSSSSDDSGAPGETSVNPGLTGKFWYRPAASEYYYHTGAADGMESEFMKRPFSYPRSKFLVPSPDGTKYALLMLTSDTLTDEEFTHIEVFDSATKTSAGSIKLTGHASALRFSPDNKYLGMMRSTALLDKYDGITVLDLSNPAALKPVVAFAGSPALYVFNFDWLPNGQYLYLRSDNKLYAATPGTGGNDDQLKGTITPPAGHRTARSLDVSPDGNQILLKFVWEEPPSTKIDVWIADTTGANLERVTTSKMTDSALWSPDGQYIAMKSDAGAACIPGYCDSYCRRWYVPKTARNVNEHTGGGGIPLRGYGRYTNAPPTGLPCHSDFAWTK